MSRSVICLLALATLSGCDDAPAPVADGPAQKTVPAAPALLTLKDNDGNTCTPLAADGRKATVLIFLMHDCPVANASAPELARLAAEFTPRGMQFYGIYTTETAAEITAHRKDYNLPFPGLLDPKLQLARLAGATRVPETVVLSPSGELLYRGRIDDRAVKPGVTKPVPHQHDLRLALEAVRDGKQPDPKFTKTIGCYLPSD